MNDAQQSGSSEKVTPTFEEMQDNLDRRRKDILTVLNSADNSRMNTSDLRRTANVPSGSMTHHMQKLERWGLVEEGNRVYVGGGSRAIVWQLTEEGMQFCEEHLDDLRALPSQQEVKHLRERVTELETRLSDLEEQRQTDIDDLEARVEQMVNQLRDDLFDMISEDGTAPPGGVDGNRQE